MTDQEMIIEIAKLDGFEYSYMSDTFSRLETPNGPRVWYDNPLPYLTSRDAIVPVIEKLTEVQKTEFGECLAQEHGYIDDYYDGWCVNGNTFALFICSSARLLGIALLKAVGKWKD